LASLSPWTVTILASQVRFVDCREENLLGVEWGVPKNGVAAVAVKYIVV
jgi:hypothetical protein